jgi:hypothetical protein
MALIPRVKPQGKLLRIWLKTDPDRCRSQSGRSGFVKSPRLLPTSPNSKPAPACFPESWRRGLTRPLNARTDELDYFCGRIYALGSRPSRFTPAAFSFQLATVWPIDGPSLRFPQT